jgi:hypothetical protein
MSGSGVRAALILLRLPSFDGDVEDSHNFDVEALAFKVVAGEGKDWVEADAIGRAVSNAARPDTRGFRVGRLMPGCEFGLGGALLLSLISCLSEKTSPSLDALFPSYAGNCSPDHSPYA